MMTKEQVRQLIAGAQVHIDDVILACADYCQEKADHCAKTPHLAAIGKEWEAAVRHLERAANAVER